MKKIHVISKSGLITLWILFLLYETSTAQSPYVGMWEGNFMEQFKTVILLDRSDDAGYAGKIIMYSGENRIQDDVLSKITIENHSLSFYIASKESSFKGTFNETNTELSGNFIFPDDSRHPLRVKKFEKDSVVVETTTPTIKERLKFDFPVEELKSDFRELVNKLKKYHPRLYSYTSEAAFENRFKVILGNLNSDLNIEEFYLRIAPLVASVKCSHTGIRLPRDYQQDLSDHGHFFPLKLYISDKRAYFLSAPGVPGVNLQPGSVVLAINNKPISEIIGELLSIIPSEGNCMSTKYQELNRDFSSYFRLVDPSERFQVEYSAAGSKGSIQVDANTYASLDLKEPSALPLRSFSFHTQSNADIGVLEVSSFGIRNMEAYLAFLDSTFRIMEDVPKLLLDLRDNQGGHPIFAAQLFSYLNGNDFIYFQRNPDVEDFEPLYNVMGPNQLHYKGNIYVLVNGGCLSSTGHLISLLKYHTGALFIGEEPGSSFLCNDMSVQLKLPNTGMEVNIPRTTFVTAVSGFSEEEAFSLDYEVDVSVQDLLKGDDSYKDFVYELLN